MITTIITYAKDILEIIAYIVVSCLGIIGVTSLFKFKEKKYEAAFNYLSQLQARVNSIYTMLKNNSFYEFLKIRFLPKNQRKTEIDDSMDVEYIPVFSELITEALQYVMSAKNQLPASYLWNERISLLTEFLVDCKFLKENNYWKFKNLNEAADYCSNHFNNMGNILEDIKSYQTRNFKKVYKPTRAEKSEIRKTKNNKNFKKGLD